MWNSSLFLQNYLHVHTFLAAFKPDRLESTFKSIFKLYIRYIAVSSIFQPENVTAWITSL